MLLMLRHGITPHFAWDSGTVRTAATSPGPPRSCSAPAPPPTRPRPPGTRSEPRTAHRLRAEFVYYYGQKRGSAAHTHTVRLFSLAVARWLKIFVQNTISSNSTSISRQLRAAILIVNIAHQKYRRFGLKQLQHVPIGLTERKQALVDNIDAWAMWISPPIFVLFNAIYWIHYRWRQPWDFLASNIVSHK